MTTTPATEKSAMRYSSKSDIVCAMLREMIIRGDLAGDEPLRQRELAQRFGVSQTPVREALRRLQSEGLVVNDPHRGATVARSRQGVLEDNTLIRATLESLGARLAAEAVTEDQLAQLQDLNDQMVAAGGSDDYAELNRRFHFAIYEAAGSPMLLSMMRLLWQAMPDGPQVVRTRAESAAQHQELIDALSEKDAERAAEVTARHILSAGHLGSGALR